MRRFFLDHRQLLRLTGLFAYLCTGTPLVANWLAERAQPERHANGPLLLWSLFYLLFGVLYLWLTNDLGSRRYLGSKLVGLVLMTVCSLGVGWYSHSGLSAMLIVVSSVILPWLVPFWPGVLWLALSNLALAPIFATFPEYNYSLWLALVQTSIYLGFAAITFVASLVASQQAEQREAQRQLNTELRATRAMLAESTRIAERMRIARELHDLVGHHLTALSLNLEVASHLVNEAAAEHVERAQTTARHLLADVREAVSELRQDDAIDLSQALRSLIEGVPSLTVHVETPPRFGVEDPRRAQVLLRCAQEIITNAARHAQARQLWLRFHAPQADLLCLQAWDDGRGAPQFRPGNGLRGMRERVREYGGEVTVERDRPSGFALEVRLPLGQPAPLAHAPYGGDPVVEVS